MDNLKDFKQIDEVLKGRSVESLANNFTDNHANIAESNSIFLYAPTDLGVARNGGRRGASFGPKAIMGLVKKMASHSDELKPIYEESVSFKEEEQENFTSAQQNQVQRIKNALENFTGSKIFHIGGGHDHVYPLLKAIENIDKKLIVINIDAHMDTRVDNHPHSGTPFRQFDRETKGEFELIQFGVHQFANTKSTITPLQNGKMTAIYFDEIKKQTENFTTPISDVLDGLMIDKDAIIVISLDTDAIESACMEGVSAVNHEGFPLSIVKDIYNYFRNGKLITGIYEYNPIYDNLSAKGARALASLIYENL